MSVGGMDGGGGRLYYRFRPAIVVALAPPVSVGMVEDERAFLCAVAGPEVDDDDEEGGIDFPGGEKKRVISPVRLDTVREAYSGGTSVRSGFVATSLAMSAGAMGRLSCSDESRACMIRDDDATMRRMRRCDAR